MDVQIQSSVDDCQTSTLADKTYCAGTLRYTKVGLVTLFVWLLWGDFCFTLILTIIPSVLPLKLESLNAPNWLLGTIVITIPAMMNLLVNPMISFRSDRYRSRWGRRIPFLFWATPFVTLALIALGYSDEIGRFLHLSVIVHYAQTSPTTTMLAVIAVLMLCFQFFNMFIASVYYYLFNDVVPSAYLARCMALFQMVGAAAASAYNFFMFPYARTHMRLIFVIVAGLYFVGFMLMCWKVKEGQYPPPPENIGGKKGLIAAVKTYCLECFTHRFYWTFFLMNACLAISSSIGAFGALYTLSLGLSLKQVGYLGGFAGIISTILLYPAGMISDKLHPIRVVFASMVGLLAMHSVGFIYIFYDFSPQTILIIACTSSCITLPINAMFIASYLPLYMKILPKERYGQFGSADAIIKSIATIIGGIVSGVFMDIMKKVCGGSDFYYRFIPCWTVTFTALALVCMCYLYRDWKAHGGLENYVPPKAEREGE